MEKFGCYKPGGRSMAASVAEKILAKNPDAICKVKSKTTGEPLYYKRPGAYTQHELSEKKEKLLKDLAGQDGRKKSEKQKAAAQKKIQVLADKLKTNESAYKAAMKLLHKETVVDVTRPNAGLPAKTRQETTRTPERQETTKTPDQPPSDQQNVYAKYKELERLMGEHLQDVKDMKIALAGKGIESPQRYLDRMLELQKRTNQHIQAIGVLKKDLGLK